MRDIAVLTGGTFIDEAADLSLANVQLAHLGFAKKVVVTVDSTTIMDGKGSAEDVQARKKDILAQIEKCTSDYDKRNLQERVAKLSGGVAVVKAGAPTEVEMKEIRDRIEDAINAVKAAIEEGIVPGGGLALIKPGIVTGKQIGRASCRERV